MAKHDSVNVHPVGGIPPCERFSCASAPRCRREQLACESFLRFVSSGKALAYVARVPVRQLRDVGKTGGSVRRAAAPPRVTIIDRATSRPAVGARATTATDGAARAALPAVSADDVGAVTHGVGIPAPVPPAYDVVVCDVRPARRAPPAPRLPDGPIRRKAAAAFLGVPADVLSCWRQRGTGPAFSWFEWGARRVAVYDRAELERWKSARAARAAKATQRDEREAARAARLPPEGALSYAEAAALVGLSLEAFRAQVSRGRGPKPVGRIGLAFFFAPAEVRQWISGRPKLAAAALAARDDARAEVLRGGGAAQAEPLGDPRRIDEHDVPAHVDDREQVEKNLDGVRVAGGPS